MALQASERHVILHQQALILTELLHCNHLHTKKENAKGAVTVLLKKVNPRKAQKTACSSPPLPAALCTSLPSSSLPSRQLKSSASP